MNGAELTRALVERAREEGFDAVGVAEVRPLPREERALQSWLSRGYHAGMGWMARDPEIRTDPGQLLFGCRSVVALAANYGISGEAGPVLQGKGKVALYARRRDYHRVLGFGLRRIASWIEDESGCSARAFVDTAPVLERGWAQAAGVGWIGKNANLLTRTHGSWLLLGEILCVAPLEPTTGPHADLCGACTACIEACPTGAIVEPGVVDSNRCIAYWTIEHRGAVPPERRAGMGEWIFGCDDCQTVCPWNRSFGRDAETGPLAARGDLAGLDAEEIVRMDEATFRARFAGTPIMRARWDGMRRNACIVLGNLADRSAAPTLRRTLSDPDPMVRSHADWALRRIPGI